MSNCQTQKLASAALDGDVPLTPAGAVIHHSDCDSLYSSKPIVAESHRVPPEDDRGDALR